MKILFSIVNKFLNHFSYEAKIRFLVILAFLYVVFLSGMVLYLQLSYVFLIVLICALLSFLLMYATKAIRQPLENLKIATHAFSGGDLSTRVPIISKDEVADITRAFNKMAELFEKSASKVEKISLNCLKRTDEITHILKEQEGAAIYQEDITRKILSRSRETMVKRNHFFYSLNEVNKQSDVTAGLARLGSNNLDEMEKILPQMKVASGNIVAALAMLNEQAATVADIISLLVEIADQSNLLFLNTAIKARKIGMEGAGFVIIADKIRELADGTLSMIIGMERAFNEIISEVSAAVVEADRFSSRIIALNHENKVVNESLTQLIEETKEQINTLKRIDFEKEEQFAEYTHIDELNARLAGLTYHVGNKIRRLSGDAELLFQGAKNLRPAIEKLHFQRELSHNTTL